MAKKIRFSLEMENGIEVRTLEELKENFSLEKVLMYHANGKLRTWLKDRYLDEIAEMLENLESDDADVNKKICSVFDVEYDETMDVDIEKAAERNRKLNLLKEYTMGEDFISVVDQIAFAQDELYDLLDEDIKEIYLCGERFSIPLSKKGVKYVGINNPTVVIDSKVEVDWESKNISISNVQFDEKYQEVLNRKDYFIESLREMVNKKINTSKYGLTEYSVNKFKTIVCRIIDGNVSEEIFKELEELEDDSVELMLAFFEPLEKIDKIEECGAKMLSEPYFSKEFICSIFEDANIEDFDTYSDADKSRIRVVAFSAIDQYKQMVSLYNRCKGFEKKNQRRDLMSRWIIKNIQARCILAGYWNYFNFSMEASRTAASAELCDEDYKVSRMVGVKFKFAHKDAMYHFHSSDLATSWKI